MAYFIYENWTHRRTRVHQATCGCCNDGEGVHAEDSGRNGTWHGPMLDRADALALANGLGHLDTRLCGICHP